jgi:hypothetical protein
LLAVRLGSKVCPLPEITTSVCQQLGIGVIGLLKATTKTRTEAEKRRSTVELTIKAFKDISEPTMERMWNKSIFLTEEDNME